MIINFFFKFEIQNLIKLQLMAIINLIIFLNQFFLNIFESNSKNEYLYYYIC